MKDGPENVIILGISCFYHDSAACLLRGGHIAASIQVVTEKIILRMASHVYNETKLDSFCMAGGVALNCVANGRILREGPFQNF
jgi:predicted NodU family carbamoyl transferase